MVDGSINATLLKSVQKRGHIEFGQNFKKAILFGHILNSQTSMEDEGNDKQKQFGCRHFWDPKKEKENFKFVDSSSVFGVALLT